MVSGFESGKSASDYSSRADGRLHLQRQLLPEQELVKTLEDGGILVSSKISHAMQILPWSGIDSACGKSISPEHLQNELSWVKRVFGTLRDK